MSLTPLTRIPLDVLAVRDPRELGLITAGLRDELAARLAAMADAGRRQRPQQSGRSPTVLADEAAGLAGAGHVLRRLAATLTDAARLADEHLAEAVTDELGVDRRGASIPTVDGSTVEVTISRPARTVADVEAVTDVLAAWAAADDPDQAPAAAGAARAAVGRLLALLRPSWRSTDARRLAQQLTAQAEARLAARLESAVRRTPDLRKRETVSVRITHGETKR